MSAFDLQKAHTISMHNRAQIEASKICGCFHCKSTFEPAKIDQWVDDDQTAMCPRCGIDSVLGDASGFPVGDPVFLKDMNRLWF